MASTALLPGSSQQPNPGSVWTGPEVSHLLGAWTARLSKVPRGWDQLWVGCEKHVTTTHFSFINRLAHIEFQDKPQPLGLILKATCLSSRNAWRRITVKAWKVLMKQARFMSHTIEAKTPSNWNYHFMTIFLIQHKKAVDWREKHCNYFLLHPATFPLLRNLSDYHELLECKVLPKLS